MVKLYFKKEIRLYLGLQKSFFLLMCILSLKIFYKYTFTNPFLFIILNNVISSMSILLFNGNVFVYNAIPHLINIVLAYFAHLPMSIHTIMAMNDVVHILLILLSTLYYSILYVRENSSGLYKYLITRTISPTCRIE
jgi:hypothetical protein